MALGIEEGVQKPLSFRKTLRVELVGRLSGVPRHLTCRSASGGARYPRLPCCLARRWSQPWVARQFLMSMIPAMNITELSSAQLRQAADIKEKLEAIKTELASILGGHAGKGPQTSSAPASKGKKLHWTQTPEGKARLARLIKRSWRKRRRV